MSDHDLRAAQAKSGKWHLLGPRGCLSVSAERIKAETVTSIATSGTRDWCSYCERELRIVQLERTVERLKAILDATDPTVYAARTQAKKDTWHADEECSHGPDNPHGIPLSRAESTGLGECGWCVSGVDRDGRPDRDHYNSLLAAANGGGQEGP